MIGVITGDDAVPSPEEVAWLPLPTTGFAKSTVPKAFIWFTGTSGSKVLWRIVGPQSNLRIVGIRITLNYACRFGVG